MSENKTFGFESQFGLSMDFLIYFFSMLLLFSAIMVITQRNSLYSVLFLVSSFLSASILILLLDNEFLALFFLIIYLGAIAILFLFVVMMLDIKYRDLQTSRIYFPMGVLIGATLFADIWVALSKSFGQNSQVLEPNVYLNWYDIADSLIDINVVSQFFYTHYVLQILIAGLILYVAVIGVAFLTIKSAYQSSDKDQILFKQLARRQTL